MLEAQFAEVEKTTSLDVDPKPVDPAAMAVSAKSREYSHPPQSRSADAKPRDQSPSRLAHGHSAHHQQQQQQQQHQHTSSTNAWAEAFEHLQSTVHYNTTVLEDHRRVIAEFHDVLGRMHSEIGQLWAHVDRCREDIRQRPPPPQSESRSEALDVDLLTVQVQTVAAKANEVDGLKMQLEIMTRRLRRLEGHGSPAPPQLPEATSCAPPHTSHTSHPYPPPLTHATPSSERTIVHHTPGETRLPPPSALQVADSRPLSDYPPSGDNRTLPGFRVLEAASGASAAWRATGLLSGQQPGAQVEPQAHTPHMESQQPTGWAAVNVGQPPKRPSSHEVGQSFEGSASGSPKRQKLVALMPRSSYGGDSSNSAQSSFHQQSATPENPSLTRMSSNETHISSHGTHFSSASLSAPNSLRIVQYPGTRDGDSAHMSAEARTAAMDANRRGGRGGAPRVPGRARRSTNATMSDHGGESMEWDRTSWAGSQVGANESGYYHGPHAGSPPESARRDQLHTSNIYAEHVPAGQAPETPTPASAAFGDASKKSRTKPVRNADGVLIRKDGRPDMRSVSSAMNLRKVHAKKEAERNNGGKEEDDTPPSVGGGGEDSHSPHDEEKEKERHRENMRKIFPYGIDAARAEERTDGDGYMQDRDNGDEKMGGTEEMKRE